jgi:indole-3-glycerol phosphate synthase
LSARPDLLSAIVAASWRRAAVARAGRPTAELERLAFAARPDAAAFEARLGRPGSLNVIAECKRRSPSKGILRAQYDPVAIAGAYARAGAAAVSVLTEPTFFDGSLSDLERVCGTVTVPVLRKDFITDEYQLLEARAAGASAVLLIVAALDRPGLAGLLQAARSLGLASLVEVHDRAELEWALEAGSQLVGVNARDLRTLEVDSAVVLALADAIPDHVVAVAESGIRSAEDLRLLRAAGYDAFLVGERLVTCADPGLALSDLLGAEGAAG